MNKITIQGKEVIDLLPTSDVQAALVDINVVKRLAGLLSTTSFYELKISTMNGIKASNTLEEMINVMKDEVRFHETINLIKAIEPEAIAVARQEESSPVNYEDA